MACSRRDKESAAVLLICHAPSTAWRKEANYCLLGRPQARAPRRETAGDRLASAAVQIAVLTIPALDLSSTANLIKAGVVASPSFCLMTVMVLATVL
jgi:hypothetical protein